MLIQVCEKCRSFINDGQLYEVKVRNGNITDSLNVCQKCYSSLSEETDNSKLLLEN